MVGTNVDCWLDWLDCTVEVTSAEWPDVISVEGIVAKNRYIFKDTAYTECYNTIMKYTVNSEIFAWVIFSRSFADAKFREN